MWVIFKKEIRQIFNTPVAYILATVFLVINSFFFFRFVFVQGYADLRTMFDFLPWILLFFVPALTMKTISEEIRTKTYEIVMSNPVKIKNFLVGKWLSVVVFVSMVLVLTLFIPLSLSFFGGFDWGKIFAQYIGALFLVGFLASIGLWASSLFRSQISAFILSFFIGFVFILIGADVIMVELKGILRDIFLQISVLPHYQSVIRGVFDLRDVVYFLFFIVLFLLFAYVNIYKLFINTKIKKYKKVRIYVFVVLIIFIFINFSTQRLSWKLDLTRNNAYSLSTATENIIKNIDDIVTARLFVSSKLPQQVLLVKRDVLDILNDFSKISNNFKVEIISIDSDSEKQALEYGIAPIQFNILEKQQFTLQRGYFGLVLEYAGEKETIPYIKNTDNLEYQITRLVYKLTNEEKKKIGILSDRVFDYSVFKRELSKEYDVENIILKDDEGFSIETDVLIIVGIDEKFNEKEIENIKKYIKNGGSILIANNGVNINEQFLTAMEADDNLNDMLGEFGVTIDKNLVYDLSSGENISFRNGNFSYILPYPFWIRTSPNKDIPVFEDISTVLLLWPSSISVQEKPDTYISPILETREFGGAQTKQFDISPTASLNNENKKYSLAVSLLINNKDKDSVARILVIGDSNFISDKIFERGLNENMTFVLNSIDWLAQNVSLTTIRSKNRLPEYLYFQYDWQQSLVRYFNLVFVPLLVVLFGSLRLWLRKRKSGFHDEGINV